jgi:hypothetical protein
MTKYQIKTYLDGRLKLYLVLIDGTPTFDYLKRKNAEAKIRQLKALDMAAVVRNGHIERKENKSRICQ